MYGFCLIDVLQSSKHYYGHVEHGQLTYTPLFPGILIQPKQFTSTNSTYFRQLMTTALLDSVVEREWLQKPAHHDQYPRKLIGWTWVRYHDPWTEDRSQFCRAANCATGPVEYACMYEYVTGYRYIAHLYCLVIQAGFYNDALECWIFVRRVAGSILGRVRTEDIFLRLLHLAPNVNSPHVALNLHVSHFQRFSYFQKFEDEFQRGGGECHRV